MAFRILGFYILITELSKGIIRIPILLGEQFFSLLFLVPQFAATILVLIIAVLIWRFADALAARVTSGEEAAENSKPYAAKDLMSVAIGVIGIYLIASSLPAILGFGAQYLLRTTLGVSPMYEDMMIPSVYDIYGNGFRLIVGLWLFIGNRGVVRLRESLRGGAQLADKGNGKSIVE